MPCSCHPRLDHSNYTGKRAQVTKLLIMQFPPPPPLPPSSVQIFLSAVFKANVSHSVLLPTGFPGPF
jgi:hypothetical protein